MKNQVVLITGASSGIGMATARLLQDRGCQVRHRPSGGENEKSRKGRYAPAGNGRHQRRINGLSRPDNLPEEAGRIDVLVNNAGYGSYGALEDVPMSEAKYQFEVNIFGLARLIQLVLPAMRRQQSGKIINVSSIGGRIGEPHGPGTTPLSLPWRG